MSTRQSGQKSTRSRRLAPTCGVQVSDVSTLSPDSPADAISGTSNNSNAVSPLGLSVSDPPQQTEVQQIADKLDELINALRR